MYDLDIICLSVCSAFCYTLGKSKYFNSNNKAANTYVALTMYQKLFQALYNIKSILSS